MNFQHLMLTKKASVILKVTTKRGLYWKSFKMAHRKP